MGWVKPEVSAQRGSDGVQLALLLAQLLGYADDHTHQRARILVLDLHEETELLKHADERKTTRKCLPNLYAKQLLEKLADMKRKLGFYID